MGELIRREDVYHDLRLLKKEAEDFRDCNYKTGYISALSTVEGILAMVKPVGTEAVRHGRWVLGTMPTYGGWRCTACNQSTVLYQPPYCPNCGAKMDDERPR